MPVKTVQVVGYSVLEFTMCDGRQIIGVYDRFGNLVREYTRTDGKTVVSYRPAWRGC